MFLKDCPERSGSTILHTVSYPNCDISTSQTNHFGVFSCIYTIVMKITSKPADYIKKTLWEPQKTAKNVGASSFQRKMPVIKYMSWDFSSATPTQKQFDLHLASKLKVYTISIPITEG